MRLSAQPADVERRPHVRPTSQTCYDHEPWHYRYLGRDLAARILRSGLAPRLVLWGIQ
jgi:hypothetical protein